MLEFLMVRVTATAIGLFLSVVAKQACDFRPLLSMPTWGLVTSGLIYVEVSAQVS
jgi:hypothetical protein